jgi:DNA replication protein DnaC
MNNDRPELRLVKSSDQEIAPEILEQAQMYYTPEQLEQMAARREELKKRWTVGQISDIPAQLSAAAPVAKSLPALSSAPRSIDARKKQQMEPLPVKTEITVCPNCRLPVRDDAYGFVRNPDPNKFVKAEPCPVCSPRVKTMKAAKKMEYQLGDMFGGANIPDYALSWSFATYPADGDQIAKDEAWAFANKETMQRGLYLWGELGHGKTSLAVSILKVFMARGDSGLYIRAAQYLRLVNQVARGNDTQAAILDLAYSVGCLVLDDLGVEQATPAAIKQFYELVEERRGTNGLYTVITSNLSIDDLEERWRPAGVTPGAFHDGMRVADRLRESWGTLEIEGISLRAANYESEEGQ